MEKAPFGPSRSTSRRTPRVTALTPAPGTSQPQAFGPPGGDLATYSWTHAHMHYLPNQARREAEDAIKLAKDEANRCSDDAKDWERRHDDAESKRKESEVECLRKVHEVTWSAVRQATEYEDRIKMLEDVLEQDRATHAEEIKQHQRKAQEQLEESEALRKECEERCIQRVAAANARTKDAEDRAEMLICRCEEDVRQAKVSADTRIREIRKWAESRVRECEDQKAFEIQQLHERFLQRQRQMEETLYLNGRQKSDALDEAKRHMTAVEQDLHYWKDLQEIDYARKESRLDEWTAKQRKQNLNLESHHKGMLELEKGLHAKTMERTMARINRQLEYGDGATGGRDTPTRHALGELPSSPIATSGLAALTSGSPLARAGGTLAASST